MKAEHTISWSIRPEKKSINFGIFKHPGAENAPTPKLSSSTFEPPPTPGLKADDASQDSRTSRNASSTATEKLKSIGLKPISWHGMCEANKVSTGIYNVPAGEGGMYALVFDNTFAKSFSKTATFVLLTYPTESPPQASHHLHHIQGTTENSTGPKDNSGQRAKPVKQQSTDSVHQYGSSASNGNRGSPGRRIKQQGESESSTETNFFTGILQKRRRKRHQGWARRFFSLDYNSSTLSYYHNRYTNILRGAVPLSLAAIGANAKTRQISIDSGAEIWHLKASNQKDFEAWKRALEFARTPAGVMTPASAIRVKTNGRGLTTLRANPEDDCEWARVGALLDRVKSSRDAAKTLAKDTDPKYLSLNDTKPSLERLEFSTISGTSSTSESPSEQSANGYFNDGAGDRRPFWKRKPSSDRPMPGMFRRSVPSTPPLPPQKTIPGTHVGAIPLAPESKSLSSHPEEGLHDNCMSLLKDLDAIVVDFASLIAESKQRRAPSIPSAISRHSIDSQGDDEFFDAEGFNSSQLLAIHHETDEEGDDYHSSASGEDSGSESEVDESSGPSKPTTGPDKANAAFPIKASSLSPLPAQGVKRRCKVPPPSVSPPSLIGFLRKNVGKDLSTIATPVSANEPISLLQRVAETLEYSSLLDAAATTAKNSTDTLIYVTAFAISNLSGARVKERASRKPFNPMLGETYELVREDRGFRFLAEKISHRPVRMACQADSANWSLAQSALPTQKFWGKSAELVTEGKFRVVVHTTGHHFSWAPATSFLRNIIAGEKYVEPVGSMTIVNETTGEKATVTFKSKGMFSGRSEDVVVQTFDPHGIETPLGLVGKWTSSLALTEHGHSSPSDAPIWTATTLAPDATKRYGFTEFASSLNEITPLEQGHLPPTDSRLRPDQRAVEEGDIEQAEALKTTLEEAQRARRKALDESGREYEPRWFSKVEGADDVEEVWVAKGGGDGYWEHRRLAAWEGLEPVFDS